MTWMFATRPRCVLAVLVTVGCLTSHAQAAPSWHLMDEDCDAEFAVRWHFEDASRAMASGKAALVFHYRGEKDLYRLAFSRGTATLTRTTADGVHGLFTASIRAARGPRNFLLRRRLHSITLLVDGRRVGQSYDAGATGGDVGASDENLFAGLQYQPLEPIYFADDFARGHDETGEWETLQGEFELTQLKWTHAGERQSANAFTWRAKPGAAAMCTTGHWFWDNYTFRIHARSDGAGQFGIGVRVQDDKNYVGFRMTSEDLARGKRGECQLYQVTNGRERVLDSAAVGFRPHQWYRLEAVCYEDAVSVLVDGQRKVASAGVTLAGGGVALLARGDEYVQFDDALVAQYEAVKDDFALAQSGVWDLPAGWRVASGKGGNKTAGYIAAGVGEALTGEADWDNYVVAVDALIPTGGAAGLTVARKGDNHWAQVVMDSVGAVTVRQKAGETVNSLASGKVATGKGWHRLKVDLHNGIARVYCDYKPVVETALPGDGQGRVGLAAGGRAGTRFDNVVLWFHRDVRRTADIHEQFAKEDTMADWANAASAWVKGADGYRWNAYRLYGDHQLTVPLSGPLAGSSQELDLVIHGDGAAADSGYRLHISGQGKGKSAAVTLHRAGQQVEESLCDLSQPGGASIELRRDGRWVLGRVDGQVVVAHRDDEPLDGRFTAIRDKGARFSYRSVLAESPNLVDDAFTAAPVRWWSARGNWQVTNRWPCDDRWSFFGGLESESPMIWSKQRFRGDVQVDAWLALFMDNVENLRTGYHHPSDLNVTVCGDGTNVSSGYSLIFAGNANTLTQLWRRDELVGKNPHLLMVNPVRVNLAFQRHWFHLRLLKEGSHISAWVDGKPAAEFDDPNPLDEGQVALWTWRNGLMVARARITYQESVGLAPLPQTVQVPAAPADGEWERRRGETVQLVSTFEHGLQGWSNRGRPDAPLLTLDRSTAASGRHSLKMVNPVPGGDMAVWAGVKSFDAVKFPRIGFDYRVGPEYKANLYLTVGARMGSVLFTAAEWPGERVYVLGKLPDIKQDRRWHYVEFDIGSALRKLFPQSDTIKVENLSLASPRVEYLRSGFGGNGVGTSLNIDNFRLIAAKDVTEDDIAAVEFRHAEEQPGS